MRAVVQRVKSASVEVDGEVISRIGPGLLCLIGCGVGDTERDAEFICRKILSMRIWPDEGKSRAWDLNVKQKEYEVLCVSQFTLYGRLQKTKPDFSKAMLAQQARDFYQQFLERLRREYGLPERIKDGMFGAMMSVSLVNDGPVTFTLDSATPASSSVSSMDALSSA